MRTEPIKRLLRKTPGYTSASKAFETHTRKRGLMTKRAHGNIYCVDPSRGDADYVLLRDGEFEPHVHEAICRILKKNHTFVDVGCNIGIHSITAAKRCSKVIAFDPLTFSQEMLFRNIFLNKVSNVEFYRLAVSDSLGLVRFQDVKKRPATSHISADGNVVIPSVRLDEFLQEHIHVIKIDVEGHELAVLKGMQKLLPGRVDNIIMEVTNANEKEILSFLSAYTPVVLKDKNHYKDMLFQKTGQ